MSLVRQRARSLDSDQRPARKHRETKKKHTRTHREPRSFAENETPRTIAHTRHTRHDGGGGVRPHQGVYTCIYSEAEGSCRHTSALNRRMYDVSACVSVFVCVCVRCELAKRSRARTKLKMDLYALVGLPSVWSIFERVCVYAPGNQKMPVLRINTFLLETTRRRRTHMHAHTRNTLKRTREGIYLYTHSRTHVCERKHHQHERNRRRSSTIASG